MTRIAECLEAMKPRQMSRKEYDRRRYLSRKEEGLCVKNGCFNEPIPGETLCDYHKSYQEERREANRNANRCMCGRERAKGYQRCRDCMTRNLLTSDSIYRKRRLAGKCARNGCNDKPVDGMSTCEKHRWKNRRKKNESL